MILETLPQVMALRTEQKEQLAEELLNQVAFEKHQHPGVNERLRCRLADHYADPESGTRWEELRDQLLKRRGSRC